MFFNARTSVLSILIFICIKENFMLPKNGWIKRSLDSLINILKNTLKTLDEVQITCQKANNFICQNMKMRKEKTQK